MSDPCFRRINRNIVECKEIQSTDQPGKIAVLIETLWNVKEESVREHIAETMVLIETLWNVKIISLKPFSIIFPRINRNIVECKEQFWFVWFSFFDVLIETLWNVKHILFHTNKGDKVSINRNIVECKDKFPPGIQAGNAY